MISELLLADAVDGVQLAVAIKKEPHHTHAGVLYHCPFKDKLFLLHMGGPGQVSHDDWNVAWGWCVPRFLKPEEVLQFRVLCHYVSEQREILPYGFAHSRATKLVKAGQLGQLALDPSVRGLTCATFVLAIFATFDVFPLNLESWTKRPEDKHYIQYIAGFFNEPALAAEWPCLRYRPEEVVAACMCDNSEVPFNVAGPLGLEIVAKMWRFASRNGFI